MTEEVGVSLFRNHKVYIPTQLLKVGEDQKNIVSVEIIYSPKFRLRLVYLISTAMMAAVFTLSLTLQMVNSTFTRNLRPTTAIGYSPCLISLT